MRPTLTITGSPHCVFANKKFLHKFGYFHARASKPSYFSNFLRGKFSRASSFLFCHISHIVFLRSYKKMFWIKAWRVITMMQNMEFAFYIESIVNCLTKTRNRKFPSINSLNSISPTSPTSRPFPAPIFCYFTVPQKMFFYFFWSFKRKSKYFPTAFRASSFSFSFIVIFAKTLSSLSSSASLYFTQPLFNMLSRHNAQTIGLFGEIRKVLLSDFPSVLCQ